MSKREGSCSQEGQKKISGDAYTMPIDRSKPLPIHEPAKTMIDRVAELKKLAGSEHPGDYKSSNPDWQYECQVLNAAPAMLDILGETRPGDSDSLLYIIENILGDDIEDEISKDVLRRYQAMASKMEEVCDEHADKATGYHPECAPVCVSEAAEMLPGLLEHIDSQASQIATLKAALVQERKDKMQLDASRFGMGIPEETAMDRAKEQLARDMPWINWEETKCQK
jgi:hypothetical protein